MRAVDRGIYCKHNPYADSPQGIGYAVTISAPHMVDYSFSFTLFILNKKLYKLRYRDKKYREKIELYICDSFRVTLCDTEGEESALMFPFHVIADIKLFFIIISLNYNSCKWHFSNNFIK